MSEGEPSAFLAFLRRLGRSGSLDTSDADLLARFVEGHDESAFASLLQRHGPLVWGVCRRVLTEEHAAEDAFQATFLVLVRKARQVSNKASIRSWLYGVALRVALRARQRENLRKHHEQQVPVRLDPNASNEKIFQDVRPILDEEILRLPEKYRLPILLCYFQGQTNDEVAHLLNCSRGTIATRLARGRERLRLRLIRRGLTLCSATLIAVLSEQTVSAALPSFLLAQTAKVGLARTASVSITQLTEGALRTMFLTKLKVALVFVLAVGIVSGTGIGVYLLHAQDAAPKTEDPFQKRGEERAEKKSTVKQENRLQKLLKERRDKAEQALQVRMELYKNGSNEPGAQTPITLEMVMKCSQQLVKAEVELTANKAERVTAREKHLKRLKEIAKITEAQFKVGRVSLAALASSEYEALDAEIELEREKMR